jgi:hypothetical protein
MIPRNRIFLTDAFRSVAVLQLITFYRNNSKLVAITAIPAINPPIAT